MPFASRLIRFQEHGGEIHYGEPIIDGSDDLHALVEAQKLEAKVIEGDIFDVASTTSDRVLKAHALLPLFGPEDIPIIRCVGLNYMEHAKEVGAEPPINPVTFVKPATSVAGWNQDIFIPKIAQDGQADYEGELCFVIGKPAKDVKASEAMGYVAGFLVGNDVSSRKWQNDKVLSGPAPQFTFSKGFDSYAPLGPVLVSPSIVGNGQGLGLETRVNGELRQKSNTSDLIFSVEKIIEFMSQGTTLQKGCVIMTGTPPGAGFSFKPPRWLQDGDVVEIAIERLGAVKNTFRYA